MAEEEDPQISSEFPIMDSEDQDPIKNNNLSIFQNFHGLVTKYQTPLSLSSRWSVGLMIIYLM